MFDEVGMKGNRSNWIREEFVKGLRSRANDALNDNGGNEQMRLGSPVGAGAGACTEILLRRPLNPGAYSRSGTGGAGIAGAA